MDGVPPPISPADLAQFQRAAQIRDLFFGAGGKDPAVRFDITPAELDSGARQVTLNLNGDEIRYAFGPLQAHQVIWPGPNRMGTVRLVFDPPATDGTVLQGTGPWALFRLFAQGALRRDSGTDRYTLTFTQGDRRAVFQIQTGSVQNPLDPALLTGFRCPAIPP
jgi:type VI secretion system protein ImpL